MANRYWVAASAGNWNDTANWSTSSGGAGGASVPGSSDDVIFDGNGSGDCNVNVDVDVLSITFTSYTGTFEAGSSVILVAGDVSASGTTAIVSLSSSSWTIGGRWAMRFISSLSSIGTSSLTMTNTSGASWQWLSSGGSWYNLILAPNAVVTVGRNMAITGRLELQQDSVFNCGFYQPIIAKNASLLLGNNCEITTTVAGLFFILEIDGTGSRVGNPTAKIGNCRTQNTNAGTVVTIPIATYTGDLYLLHNAASYDTEYIFEGDTVINGKLYTGAGKARFPIVDTSTNNANLTLRGDVDITVSQGAVSWSAGTGIITLDNSSPQSINFNSQTIEAIRVSDESTQAITLNGDFTTPYVHDCNNLIDLNGFTITETGTDPSPCFSGAIYHPFASLKHPLTF